MKRLLTIFTLLVLAAGDGIAAERSKAVPPPSPLRMEDLEVRGLKEMPELLFAPGLKGAARPAPVLYDLFLVDMNRAVSPRETAPQAPPAGGDPKP